MVLLHDILNQLPYDADWSLLDCSKLELLLSCKKLKKGVLLIGDRGYPSTGLYAMLDHQQVKFVIRVPLDRRVKAIKTLLESGKDELIVDLTLDEEQRKFCAFHGVKRRLGSSQRVRLVKVTLADGSPEILATNLRRRQFPASCFSAIYKMRWCVKTFSIITSTASASKAAREPLHETFHDGRNGGLYEPAGSKKPPPLARRRLILEKLGEAIRLSFRRSNRQREPRFRYRRVLEGRLPLRRRGGCRDE